MRAPFFANFKTTKIEPVQMQTSFCVSRGSVPTFQNRKNIGTPAILVTKRLETTAESSARKMPARPLFAPRAVGSDHSRSNLRTAPSFRHFSSRSVLSVAHSTKIFEFSGKFTVLYRTCPEFVA